MSANRVADALRNNARLWWARAFEPKSPARITAVEYVQALHAQAAYLEPAKQKVE